MKKPQMTNQEIDLFINYIECCMIDMIDIKEWVDCLKVLKCDLKIYRKRNDLKEVRDSGSKG